MGSLLEGLQQPIVPSQKMCFFDGMLDIPRYRKWVQKSTDLLRLIVTQLRRSVQIHNALNAKNGKMQTPLHLAAGEGDSTIGLLLLERGAEVAEGESDPTCARRSVAWAWARVGRKLASP